MKKVRFVNVEKVVKLSPPIVLESGFSSITVVFKISTAKQGDHKKHTITKRQAISCNSRSLFDTQRRRGYGICL